MQEIILLLAISGASALFLFGMKLMSESLQKIFGERLRVILTSMTTNKFKGVLAGILITALVQSSSATTVMVVSFVNAGILRLVEAVSVIMGANIGTTLTSWIIAVFGFKINFAYFTLPLIGIGIPFIFSNNRKTKNYGEAILGFSLLFIALGFLKTTVPNPQGTWLSETITQLSSYGYVSYILFMAVSLIITVFIKSSNAIFALILVLCFKGWIGFEMSASMVLGMNVGTTIAAITASRQANLTARRAALAHLFFNLAGIIWMFIALPYFLNGINFLFATIGINGPMSNPKAIPVALALFHSLFNLINTVLLSGFSKHISRMVIKRIPFSNLGESEFNLKHIKIGLLSTPEASIFQAKRETIVFAESVRKMFRNIEKIFSERNEKEYLSLKTKIEKAEEYSDRLEKEIAVYLTKVGEGRLSENSSKRLRALYKMIDDIESIADSCMNILGAIERKQKGKIIFTEHIVTNVLLMFNMVNEALDTMVTMLTYEEELPLSLAQKTENEINNYRDILKSEHLNNLEKGIYKYDAGIIYNDIISQCERIGDFAFNVAESHKSSS
ncbi:MAG: Na/Pi cotransporter family protein [Prolixibacteraceae bacterium]|nr:Na/Pi cotransporter family protein [Prolixibacteraceae bacterium]